MQVRHAVVAVEVRGVEGSRPVPGPVAWGARFVDALRQARAVASIPPASSVRPAGSAVRVYPAQPQASAGGGQAAPAGGSLWDRLVGFLSGLVRGALDLLYSGLETALRWLGGLG